MKKTILHLNAQITVFHVLWLSFIALCAFIAGRKLAVFWGKAGWAVGGLVGIACGFLLFYALWLLDDFYHRFRPLRPLADTENAILGITRLKLSLRKAPGNLKINANAATLI